MRLEDFKFYAITALAISASCMFCLSIWAFLEAFHFAFFGTTSLSENFSEWEPESTIVLIKQAMWLKMAALMVDNIGFAVLLPTVIGIVAAAVRRKQKSAPKAAY